MDRRFARPEVDHIATALCGGLWRRSSDRPTTQVASDARDWLARCNAGELFVSSRGSATISYQHDDIAAYLRGYAVPASAPEPVNQQRVLCDLVEGYLTTGRLPIECLEGSFTLTLLDGRSERILIYRNLGDCHLTYYSQSANGPCFSNNLVTLLRLSGNAPKQNERVLPELFLFRTVPGRETLFEGIRRLGPGQMLTIDHLGCTVTSLQTIEDLRGPVQLYQDSVDAVEAAIDRVLRGYATTDAGGAVLLSGGVDSSFLQTHWNSAQADRNGNATSVAIVTDHPVGRLEREYAATASRLLSTQHCEVAATRPYAEYLVRTIAATGELPNHVQTAYFMPLADAMADLGITLGLCGQAADALFGSPWGDYVHRARRINRIVPSAWLRERLGGVAEALNKPYWARACRLANFLEDLHNIDHPVNHNDTFGDFEAVRSCFGSRGLADACASRRELLEQMRVRDDVLYRVNEIAFVADSYDTCSLWGELFEAAGVRLWFPFMDSRLLRVAANIDPRFRFAYRQPKWVLKTALRRHMPGEFVRRPKLAFAQPIYEWLAEGGQLRSLVERIDEYEFVDEHTLVRAKKSPNAFLYCLLCYDIWHKLFIQNVPADVVLNAGETLSH